MRTNFIKTLIEEAEKNDRIFLIVGDLGYSVVEEFRDRFPKQFLNIGIAEQNMAGFASGLAREGYTVFIYSIGNFPTLRALEQIRYNICYHDMDVKIVSVGAGYSYGALGCSHHATEDIGILRCLPNLRILSPSDPLEARELTRFATSNRGPMYLRLGKAGEPNLNAVENSIEEGQPRLLTKGISNDVALFSTGSISNMVQKYLVENSLGITHYSFPFLSDLNQNSLKSILHTYSKIITIEEHQSDCGFGSLILEVCNDIEVSIKDFLRPVILRKAIPNKFISFAGSQEYLREMAGLQFNSGDFEC
jgi:transketolase